MSATPIRPRRLRRRLLSAVAIVTASVAGFGAMAGAGIGPLFNDVPAAHPFFDEIQSVAMNCIADGYDDGTFRPGNDVTRQAMAAFLDRTGSRLGWSNNSGGATPTVGHAAPNTSSAWVEVAHGSVGLPDNGCDNQVMIEGTAAVYSSQTAVNACHATTTCNVELGLFADGVQIGASFTRINTDFAAESLAVQGTFVAETGANEVDYTLEVRTYNVKPGQANVGARSVLGTFHPFVGRTVLAVAGS